MLARAPHVLVDTLLQAGCSDWRLCLGMLKPARLQQSRSQCALSEWPQLKASFAPN